MLDSHSKLAYFKLAFGQKKKSFLERWRLVAIVAVAFEPSKGSDKMVVAYSGE